MHVIQLKYEHKIILVTLKEHYKIILKINIKLNEVKIISILFSCQLQFSLKKIGK